MVSQYFAPPCPVIVSSLYLYFTVGDEQGARPRTGSVLIECDVREMSSKNESVSSEVTESVPICLEDGAFAGIDVKEGETETVKGSESQSTNTIPVPKAKKKKKKQKKGPKGASGTLTATNAKDSEVPQNVDENTCLEGIAFTLFITLRKLPLKIRKFANNIHR